MTKPTAELCLATHVAKMKFADLPSHTIERAKTFIADSLSVGIAGSIVPESIRLLQSLQSSDLGGQVSVWGTKARLSAPNAIIANAFNIHCQEYDCLHEGAVVHAMATLLPVLMAEAASGKNVSGKDLITAVVAGIDIACTLGLAANQAMQFSGQRLPVVLVQLLAWQVSENSRQSKSLLHGAFSWRRPAEPCKAIGKVALCYLCR